MLHKMKVRKLEKIFLKKITMELWAKNIHIQFYLALLETPLRATYDFDCKSCVFNDYNKKRFHDDFLPKFVPS